MEVLMVGDKALVKVDNGSWKL